MHSHTHTRTNRRQDVVQCEFAPNKLYPLDYWVLDTGAAWTMTPRKKLLDDVRAAPINEVCSACGHALKVAGAGRAALKGADGKPVVLHDVLLVPDLMANLISLCKLAKARLNLTPSVWEEGDEAAAEGGDGERVQEAPAGGGDAVEASDSTSGAAGPEGGQQQCKAKAPTLP
ncbi:unnamed protein product [Closterium sp. NIES-53]